jgi:hypothetical protein
MVILATAVPGYCLADTVPETLSGYDEHGDVFAAGMSAGQQLGFSPGAVIGAGTLWGGVSYPEFQAIPATGAAAVPVAAADPAVQAAAAAAASPILDERGEYNGVISMALDITQVKQSEEAVEKEKALADIYLDLMAHDINNLDQVAIGYIEIAIDGLLQEKHDESEIVVFLNK